MSFLIIKLLLLLLCMLRAADKTKTLALDATCLGAAPRWSLNIGTTHDIVVTGTKQGWLAYGGLE